MLVVVKNGDFKPLCKLLLDVNASWRRNILQVDTTESRSQAGTYIDDLANMLRVEADRKGVDPPKLLEQHSLSFHDRQSGLGTDVTQAQYGGGIGDDGHRVSAHGESESRFGVRVDRLAYPCDTGCVRHGKIVARLDGHLGCDFNLAAQMHQESAVGYTHNLDALNSTHSFSDALRVCYGSSE